MPPISRLRSTSGSLDQASAPERIVCCKPMQHVLPYGLLNGDHQLWIRTYTRRQLLGLQSGGFADGEPADLPLAPDALTITTIQGRPQLMWPQDDNGALLSNLRGYAGFAGDTTLRVVRKDRVGLLWKHMCPQPAILS